jgi:hypothetical protein
MAFTKSAALASPAGLRASAALLRPIGLALAALIVGVPAIFAWNIYSASEARRLVHERPVVQGSTTLTTAIKRKVSDNELEFILREANGQLSRVIVSKAEGERFVNDTLAALDRARQETKAKAAQDLDALFATAFAGRDADLEAYADWFFEWGQSWRLLYEALTGAVQEAGRLAFSQTQISDAARHSVEAYLLRHYEQFILKPGARDPVITAGVRKILATANDAYFASVAKLDERVRGFLARETLFRERIDAGTVSLDLDWDAEKWRAPRTLAVDRYTEPARTAILVGGGALVVGPLIQKATAPMLARLAGKVTMSSRMVIGGASIGSVQPGLGTLIGALGGLAVDWGLSQFQEYLERDDFIAANNEALDGTILSWKGAILPSIDAGIDVWFDDAQALVAGWNVTTGAPVIASEATP